MIIMLYIHIWYCIIELFDIIRSYTFTTIANLEVHTFRIHYNTYVVYNKTLTSKCIIYLFMHSMQYHGIKEALNQHHYSLNESSPGIFCIILHSYVKTSYFYVHKEYFPQSIKRNLKKECWQGIFLPFVKFPQCK